MLELMLDVYNVMKWYAACVSCALRRRYHLHGWSVVPCLV